MTVEYAAIWRAKQLAERDMRVIRARLGFRRMGQRMGGLGVAAAAATRRLGGFHDAFEVAIAKEHEEAKRRLSGQLDT